MKLKKRYQLLLIAIVLFLVDFGLTWYFLNYSSYAEEGNPLFLIDGGYLSLIINFIYVSIVFIIGYIIEKYQTIVLEAKNGFDYFIKLYKTDRTDYIIISFLTAFIFATFASRTTVIIDWVIYGIYQSDFFSTKYAIMRDQMPLGRYDVVVTFISLLLFVPLWFKLEYKKSKVVLSVKKYKIITHD
jgi:hypothetical protein